MFKFLYLVLELSPGTAQLATSACNRLLQSFRPATQRTYSRMFQDFMGFLVASGLSLGQVNIYILLAFLEYLHSNALTATNICNHLAGIRAFFILYGLPTDMFQDQRIQMFMKSLKINRPLMIKSTPVFSTDMLLHIVLQSQKFEFPHIFAALYLLAFYSFLRLSNIVPHSFMTFDISRHLARGDIIFGETSAVVILKWSKTNQLRNKVQYVTIPVIPHSLLCPVVALQTMMQKIPGSKNDPLFAVPRHGKYLPLTDSMVRKHLNRVVKALGWENQKYTFHIFRRSGASWAHNHGVPIQAIKDQGTWSSDCVYRYISSDTHFSSSPLLTAFKQHLQA